MPHRPNKKQAFFLELEAEEALYGGAAGGGKLLPLTTPIPTPSGWTTMGELRAGDVVFDADGKPTRVEWCSRTDFEPSAWQLIFDDGSAVVADSRHQWVTLTEAERSAAKRLTAEFRASRRATRASKASGNKSKRFTESLTARNATREHATKAPPSPRGSTRTTFEIIKTLKSERGAVNHCIQNPAPIDLPALQLRVDPYVLGAWLGDGTSASGSVSGLDDEVFESIAAAGYLVVPHANGTSRGVHGLAKRLKRLRVLRAKHIPQEYLRASIEQRVALLQGLCDTDGHATAKGSIEFTTTSERLMQGFMELLASLGIKASCRPGRATLRGRDIGPKWRIQFWTEIDCFRIARKRARQKRSGFRGTHSRRFIVSARRVESVPMRCIGVDSPSHTYLCGLEMIVTHNSDALLMSALQFVDVPGYAAGIWRKTKPDLNKPNAILARAHEWFRGTPAQWDSELHGYRFPTKPGRPDSLLHFGYMQGEADRDRYQGAEFQFLGIDEVTQWSEANYRYLFSRLRKLKGFPVPLRMRATGNPGGIGHAWVKRRFFEWARHVSGVDAREYLRRRRRGEPLPDPPYFESPPTDDAIEIAKLLGRKPQGAFFVPAFLEDNPGLDQLEYRAQLAKLDVTTREQLEHGDWDVVASGNYFRPQWFNFADKAPDGMRWIRYWDLAGTKQRPERKHDPDWSAGVKIGIERDAKTQINRVWIADVEHFREDPGETERRVRATAERDTKRVTIWLEEEPGSSGKNNTHNYKARVLFGWHVEGQRKTGPKPEYWKPLSSVASSGNLWLVSAPWNDAYVQELCSLPIGHDDQADGSGGGLSVLTTNVDALRARALVNAI